MHIVKGRVLVIQRSVHRTQVGVDGPDIVWIIDSIGNLQTLKQIVECLLVISQVFEGKRHIIVNRRQNVKLRDR